jgi:arylsulfatase
LIFEHEHNGAIRDGDWKLVGNDGLNREGFRPGGNWKLFNLRQDPAELENLAEKEPARVKDLSKRFLDEAKRTLVLPSP